MGHRLHNISPIVALVDNYAATSDDEVFVAVGHEVLNLRYECITLKLLGKIKVFKIFATQALHEGLILKLESFEFSSDGSFALDGVVCVSLEGLAFLFQFLTPCNINLIVLMHTIDLVYVIFWLLFHFKK